MWAPASQPNATVWAVAASSAGSPQLLGPRPLYSPSSSSYDEDDFAGAPTESAKFSTARRGSSLVNSAVENFQDFDARPLESNGYLVTFVALFKSTCGSGVAFVPRAFSNSGWLVGVLLYPAFGFLSVYGTLLVLECDRVLRWGSSSGAEDQGAAPRTVGGDQAASAQQSASAQQTARPSSPQHSSRTGGTTEERLPARPPPSSGDCLSYTDLKGPPFSYAQLGYHALGPFGLFVEAAIVLSPIFFCTVYLIFIADTLLAPVNQLLGRLTSPPPSTEAAPPAAPPLPLPVGEEALVGPLSVGPDTIILLLGLFFTPLLWTKELVGGLDWVNRFGSLAILFAVGVVLYYCGERVERLGAAPEVGIVFGDLLNCGGYLPCIGGAGPHPHVTLRDSMHHRDHVQYLSSSTAVVPLSSSPCPSSQIKALPSTPLSCRCSSSPIRPSPPPPPGRCSSAPPATRSRACPTTCPSPTLWT